jgi:ABC-type Zn2+ transport system substrate-binding protein/surface adhesin
MNTTEKPGQRFLQQLMQRSYIASSQAIGIRDKLNIVFHTVYLYNNARAAKTGNPTINPS